MSAVRQLVVLSGKGGAGKTSVTAALVHLTAAAAPRAPVLVDADVDAANLSLVLQPQRGAPQPFWGGGLAEIAAARCTGCGACVPVCRYDAVLQGGDVYAIDPLACDGCAACVYACPEGAVRMIPQQQGNWFQSATPYGTLFHAELFPGKENSGKLVAAVRQQARTWAEAQAADLIISDGPPGIGCPVIAACTGVDLVLLVAEPSLAGRHDLARVLGVVRHFRIPAALCLNQADLYPAGAAEIRAFAAAQGLPLLGEIPFDPAVPQAMLRGLPVTAAAPAAPAARAIAPIWEGIQALLANRLSII